MCKKSIGRLPPPSDGDDSEKLWPMTIIRAFALSFSRPAPNAYTSALAPAIDRSTRPYCPPADICPMPPNPSYTTTRRRHTPRPSTSFSSPSPLLPGRLATKGSLKCIDGCVRGSLATPTSLTSLIDRYPFAPRPLHILRPPRFQATNNTPRGLPPYGPSLVWKPSYFADILRADLASPSLPPPFLYIQRRLPGPVRLAP